MHLFQTMHLGLEETKQNIQKVLVDDYFSKYSFEGFLRAGVLNVKLKGGLDLYSYSHRDYEIKDLRDKVFENLGIIKYPCPMDAHLRFFAPPDVMKSHGLEGLVGPADASFSVHATLLPFGSRDYGFSIINNYNILQKNDTPRDEKLWDWIAEVHQRVQRLRLNEGIHFESDGERIVRMLFLPPHRDFSF